MNILLGIAIFAIILILPVLVFKLNSRNIKGFSKRIRKYNIVYHFGKSIGLSTKAMSGRLEICEGLMKIVGKEIREFKISEFNNVSRHSMIGLGTMIKIEINSEFLFIAVVRLNLGGYFVIVNKLATEYLLLILKAIGNELKQGAKSI
jgi:hypothetical protein